MPGGERTGMSITAHGVSYSRELVAGISRFRKIYTIPILYMVY